MTRGTSRDRPGVRIAAVALAWSGTALPRGAFAAGVAPDFQSDPVEQWAGRILLWGALVALVLIAALLVACVRGRLAGGFGRSLLIVGVVVLPWFCVATGMLLVLSRATRVEFCGSCHRAIGPYVDDMLDPEVPGLAALHYRYRYIPHDQCYECHTSYGLFGSIEAKVHGVRQVLRYYSGEFAVPLSAWRPYSNADCLKCHAGSRGWLDEASHVRDGVDGSLFSDELSCMDCHDAGHGDVRRAGAAG